MCKGRGVCKGLAGSGMRTGLVMLEHKVDKDECGQGRRGVNTKLFEKVGGCII